jgi:bifunctional non-homologous end joining protein LigD
MKWRERPETIRPMLATLAEAPLTSPGLIYEPKYDGIRALVHVAAGRGTDPIRIWSRLGNDKTSQFPSIVRELAALRNKLDAPLLLDGEIVALDEKGRPAGFQRLQGRIHLTALRDVEIEDKAQPTALITFDLLRDGDEDLRGSVARSPPRSASANRPPATGARCRRAHSTKAGRGSSSRRRAHRISQGGAVRPGES